MAQYLTLPLNKAQLTAGYKNAAYRQKFGFSHFGMDLSNSPSDARTLWGMGNGTVKAAGYDNIFGNAVVVVYPDCYNRKTKKAQDLTVRLYHLASVAVKTGQPVTPSTKLGVMGNTGKYSTGVHVHVEIDRDTDMPTHVPGLAKSSNILKKGIDTTYDPAGILYLGKGQTLTYGAGQYGKTSDINLPAAPSAQTYMVEAGPMTRQLADMLAGQIKSSAYKVKVVEAK